MSRFFVRFVLLLRLTLAFQIIRSFAGRYYRLPGAARNNNNNNKSSSSNGNGLRFGSTSSGGRRIDERTTTFVGHHQHQHHNQQQSLIRPPDITRQQTRLRMLSVGDLSLSSKSRMTTTTTTTTFRLAATTRSTMEQVEVRNKNNITKAIVTVSQTERTPLLFKDADRIRRRHLLLSMLAAANTSPLLMRQLQSPAYATATEVEEEATANTAVSAPTNIHVIKPPLDNREYMSYTLESNGLRVLICSDSTSNEAAAAMDVHVGALSDPTTIPGMAHFNEHMLFLGTKLYPSEGSFEKFLSSNGGSSNAYTDSENTVFYFDMETEDTDEGTRFAEGLSRFGSFFASPLFTESATGRELNAIDSENAKNLQSDSFRFFQLMKGRASQQHPFHKFSTGNKKTLLDDTRSQNLNLRQELVKFYNQYYSSNQMTLAVIGPESLDDLKGMVNDAFSQIPNKHVPKPEESWKGILPFVADTGINDSTTGSTIPSFGHVVELVPVSDIRQVTITWPIIYNSDSDRQESLLVKPSNYVAHLLGHEGPKSLLSYLKKKGWANTVACGAEESLSDFDTLDVVVGLTTSGLIAVNDVIEAVFSYITMMRDRPIPSYVFEEVLQLDELQWRFLTKGQIGGYVQSIATAMQKYPPELYVAGPRRLALDGYDDNDNSVSDAPRTGFSSQEQLDSTKRQVENLANTMTVDNAIVSVFSKSFQGQTTSKEKWYGTDYRVRRISPETLDRWTSPVPSKKLGMDFPKPNPFIPSEIGLRLKKEPRKEEQVENRISLRKRKSFEEKMVPIEPPQIIRDDGMDGKWTVYFKPDDKFGQPKGYVIFQLLTRDVYSTPTRAALGNLYEITVQDRLREYAYDAELAGLTYDVKVLPRGIRLTFAGYNDKLKDFASYVCKKLSPREILRGGVLPRTDTEFDRYKDQIMRGLSAFDVKQPYAHASYYAQITLQPHRFQYTNSELRDETRKLTLPDLVEYVKDLWSFGHGEMLVQGNFDRNEALGFVDTIEKAIPFKPISADEYPPRLEALPLPKTSPEILPTRVLVAEPNPSNENACSYMMLQSLGESERDHVLIEIMSAILSEPFYNELRTKKQLGYIVSSGVKGIADSRQLAFVVQSSTKTADALTVEILNFLEDVETKILEKVSKADVAVYVKSLIDRKTEPDKALTTEVTRNWSEIASGRKQFDRLQKEAAALLDINKQDLLDFWKTIYAGESRRAIISEIIPRQQEGSAAASASPPTSTGYTSSDMSTEGLLLGIDDLEQFRRDREKLVYSNNKQTTATMSTS